MVRAIYDGIYKDLLDRIVDGEYAYQSFIPSEAVLVKHYDCSHNTLRRARAAHPGRLRPARPREGR